ncbi:IclR family transcriptional regulator domain-containing protein [Bradyrhizobium valentinum]|uniref:IclR family transcriptional regulator domain-containing protein n=1 Tax=Bradyrhizobium valentinum TaxID=1518501 RepID=UPI000709B0AF|nr:IclR family transcriptional regulator C-terminal domain-containing protein [Bradyrhizobium valentinum]KRQ95961.1 hypothetical protein CQ10_05815 [Bradyrhizobium valentinum]
MDKSAIAEVLRKCQAWPPRPGSEPIDPPVFTAGATDPHVGALAMPVFGADAKLIGVLALSGPVARLTPERVKSMGAILSKAAWKLTRALGGPDERTDGRLGCRGIANLTARLGTARMSSEGMMLSTAVNFRLFVNIRHSPCPPNLIVRAC